MDFRRVGKAHGHVAREQLRIGGGHQHHLPRKRACAGGAGYVGVPRVDQHLQIVVPALVLSLWHGSEVGLKTVAVGRIQHHAGIVEGVVVGYEQTLASGQFGQQRALAQLAAVDGRERRALVGVFKRVFQLLLVSLLFAVDFGGVDGAVGRQSELGLFCHHIDGVGHCSHKTVGKPLVVYLKLHRVVAEVKRQLVALEADAALAVERRGAVEGELLAVGARIAPDALAQRAAALKGHRHFRRGKHSRASMGHAVAEAAAAKLHSGAQLSVGRMHGILLGRSSTGRQPQQRRNGGKSGEDFIHCCKVLY